MIIRRMKEEDLPEVQEMENSIFSKPWSITDFKDSMKKPHNIYLVVEERSEIVAYCGLWGVAGEGQINNVAVKKMLRGQGIGRNMLQELIDLGKKQGLVAFTLEVRVGNLSAIALYRRLGFLDAGIRKNFYEAPAEDALIMWLQ
ncbi:ribosomal protein S18-alanine N-acetyltransferase [Anaerocolumna sp. AGMB13025]|uniref:ribosomal protein S18-alanine N-acetyltransferase n=1 Tax=Anaerocolumna sp. AGMB13025 TaxID=3039116 RepID=UPI00241CAC72|nr:ribosomal protein S18-alanine N-acetyltransferase [Anaerocolumna sp. AGMB13025]WFR57911.1 ribosomal protein S18-alanine N-acetyltransferase [Anaerocolumna sp. AGMB13025]